MANHTLQEILSQPAAWETVITMMENETGDSKKYPNGYTTDGHQTAQAIFIGCGTSFYLAQSAASIYSKITDVPSRAAPASEVFLFPDSLFAGEPERYQPFLISRSGETTEVLWAAKYIHEHYGIYVNGITCRPGSELLGLADHSFIIPAADEKSVVMTRSFSSMLLLIQYLASLNSEDREFRGELHKLPEIGSSLIKKYKDLPDAIVNEKEILHYVYLGQGPFYGLANESMLKVKEMSLSSSQAYHTLEFRHGPKSMINENMLVTFLFSEMGFESEINVLKEVKKLGARTLSICEEADSVITEYSDYVVELNSGLSDYARLILYMPVTQLLGFNAATAKKMDPDAPANLSQVVTL